jgi:hypothetical protein
MSRKFSVIGQENYEHRHVYAFITEFYYLDILPDNKYSLKIGMYGDQYVKGTYDLMEGHFLGLSDFGHLCQAELVCQDSYCQAQKNRFGGNVRVGIAF